MASVVMSIAYWRTWTVVWIWGGSGNIDDSFNANSRQRLTMMGYITEFFSSFKVSNRQKTHYNMLFYFTFIFAFVTATPNGLFRSSIGKLNFVFNKIKLMFQDLHNKRPSTRSTTSASVTLRTLWSSVLIKFQVRTLPFIKIKPLLNIAGNKEMIKS